MKCQYVQHWRTRCSLTIKLQLYVDFNHDYNVAIYVLAVDIFKFRRTMSNLRSSSHPIMIEKGLHYNIDMEARTCPYCETCIEHELHLVLQCPLYASLRCKYVHDMYVNDVSEASYVRLMSSNNETTVKKIAMFVHDALKERDSFFGGKIMYIPLNRHVLNHYIMYFVLTINYSYFAKMLKC